MKRRTDMASKSEYVKIDPGKLKECIKAAGITVNRAATICGCGSALHNAISRGILAKPITYALKNELGINYEDYAESGIHTDAEQDQYEITEEVWSRLEDVIASAIKRALNE